jgi:hypothetical protein
MKRKKTVDEEPSDPPFALREQFRRRALAARIALPPPPVLDEVEERRALPPKRGSYS